MFRKVVLGSGLVATLIPSVSAATPVKDVPQRPPPMRLSELPVYESPHADYANNLSAAESKENHLEALRQAIKGPVGCVRSHVQTVLAQTSSVTGSISDTYHEFQDRTDWIVKYLREEDNKEQRYGAVVMGGLTGFILGLRGGILRRLFYAGLGTTGMGFVCFPEESSELYTENSALAKQYINIAYNFIYGATPTATAQEY